MNILLVNDDGYKAEGINTLDDVLTAAGHNIYVVAPVSEQSGKSHSMTVRGSVTVKEYRKNRYSLTGSPADCIIFPFRSGLIDNIDLVVSGINHGYNVSTDIIYSGTCGAARQAAMYGMKAIAISTDKKKDEANYNFKTTAEFLRDNLDLFVSKIKGETFLNINTPSTFSGYELADLGAIDYRDEVALKRESNGDITLEFTGISASFRIFERKHRADFEVTRNGKASLSFIDVHQHISYPNMESFND